jgi:hypothetical protein
MMLNPVSAKRGELHGQALIRRDQHGSVISHLNAEQVASLRYPIVGEPLRRACAEAFRKSVGLRESARVTLERLATEFLDQTRFSKLRLTDEDQARRFTTHRSGLTDRFDAEPLAPVYQAYRTWVTTAGSHAAIGRLATVVKPPGRYKTLYVEDERFGVKLLAGRNVAQFRPIAMKVMAHMAWDRPQDYIIAKDTVLMTCDGRAEENLADCALVVNDRAGWAASGHIIRLVPNADTNPGLLYLACSSKPVQAFLKSLATGSVVDALSGKDVGSVIVPYPRTTEGIRLGDEAIQAWDWFAEAFALENHAISELESALQAP